MIKFKLGEVAEAAKAIIEENQRGFERSKEAKIEKLMQAHVVSTWWKPWKIVRRSREEAEKIYKNGETDSVFQLSEEFWDRSLWLDGNAWLEDLLALHETYGDEKDISLTVKEIKKLGLM